MKEEKYKVINPSSNIFKSSYTGKEILQLLETVTSNDSVTFYVTCLKNEMYSNRLHLSPQKNNNVLIEIDKGSDAGTWSKEVNRDFFQLFFLNIYDYTENPKNFGFIYEEW